MLNKDTVITNQSQYVRNLISHTRKDFYTLQNKAPLAMMHQQGYKILDNDYQSTVFKKYSDTFGVMNSASDDVLSGVSPSKSP